MPIVCIDLVVENSEKKYLLLKRINQPLKGDYWVPGGRIMHYENIDNAINRILMTEVKIDAGVLSKDFLGVYQDFFTENSFESNIKYHTISLVHKLIVPNNIYVKLDNQSENFIWANELPSRFKLITNKLN
jgi:colanic acid biosynthesis protein WcaH